MNKELKDQFTKIVATGSKKELDMFFKNLDKLEQYEIFNALVMKAENIDKETLERFDIDITPLDTMDVEESLMCDIHKVLISGSREDLDTLLESYSDKEQANIVSKVLIDLAGILQESELENVKNRLMLSYLVDKAEDKAEASRKAGIDEKVYITYLDQRKLGKINSEYGFEAGDMAIYSMTRALHKGFEGINSNDYDVVRIGGDEFCIISLNRNKKEIENYLKEGKTLANCLDIKAMKKGTERMDRLTIDFAFGTTEYNPKEEMDKLNIPKNLDERIKKKMYLQDILNRSEDIAERSKKALIDREKEEEKKNTIRKYIGEYKTQDGKNPVEKISIIEKDKMVSEDVYEAKNVTLDSDNELKMSPEILLTLDNINKSKGFVKNIYKECIRRGGPQGFMFDEKNKMEISSEEVVKKLKDNLFAFSNEFIKDKEKRIIKRSSLDIALEVASENKDIKMAYLELDNLKLVNSAKAHHKGDEYINDFMNIVKEVMKESDNDSYVIKMSGNAAVMMYNEEDTQMIDEIVERCKNFNNPNIGIEMNVFVKDIKTDDLSEKGFIREFVRCDNEIKAQKIEEGIKEQKIIVSDNEYEIFYGRETFTREDILEVMKEDNEIAFVLAQDEETLIDEDLLLKEDIKLAEEYRRVIKGLDDIELEIEEDLDYEAIGAVVDELTLEELDALELNMDFKESENKDIEIE